MRILNQYSHPPRSFKATQLLLLCLAFLSLGCVSKALTKPRSEVIASALSDGIHLNSIDQDRNNFYWHEEAAENQLVAILEQRGVSEGTEGSYLIGIGDQIDLNVFDVPELNLSAKVKDSGFISLPLIGAIAALGKSEPVLQAELTEQLQKFVRNPQVSVNVSLFGSQRVSVFGAVEKPGVYALKKGSNSVIELLGEAGGLTAKAGNFLSFVPASDGTERAQYVPRARGTGERRSGLEIPLYAILGTSGDVPISIPVKGGDMIIVPEAGKVLIEGEVEKVGSYDISSGMTLLGALATAGGITYGAKIDEVELIRDFGTGEKARLLTDLQKIGSGEEPDVQLRGGDLIRVPSDTARRFNRDTFETITRLVNFGVGGSVNLAH